MRLESWLAGAFDVTGQVYRRRAGGLALRVIVPKRYLANRLKACLGGSVARIGPSLWTVVDPEELEEVVTNIRPLVQAQVYPLMVLDQWLKGFLDVEEAEERLGQWYADFTPCVPRHFRAYSRQDEAPRDGPDIGPRDGVG